MADIDAGIAAVAAAVDTAVVAAPGAGGYGEHGWWGLMTASKDWCEPNYKYSPYVAEFWNAASSLPIFLSGLYGLVQALRYGYHARFVPQYWLLAMVGIGSTAFHGTLRYTGQAMDELSMVATVCAFLYTVLETSEGVRRPWLGWALVVYNAAFIGTYLVLPDYFIFFVLTFIALCCVVMWKGYTMLKRSPDARARRLFWMSFGIYGSAFFFMWIPDLVACEYVGWLHLHAFFHLCCSLGPYWFTVFVVHTFYAQQHAAAGKKDKADAATAGATAPRVPELHAATSVWTWLWPSVSLREGSKVEAAAATKAASAKGSNVRGRGKAAAEASGSSSSSGAGAMPEAPRTARVTRSQSRKVETA